MHRDEAIYARSDARGGITLTAEEVARVLAWRDSYRRDPEAFYGITDVELGDRLEAASTTPPS